MTTATAHPTQGLAVGAAWEAFALLALSALVLGMVSVISTGSPGALGVLVGTVVVGGFFLFGTVSTGIAAAYAPSAAFVVALLTYVLQVVALPLVFVALHRSTWVPERVHPTWLAAAIIAGTAGWVVGLLVHAVRSGRDGGSRSSAGPAAAARTDEAVADA